MIIENKYSCLRIFYVSSLVTSDFQFCLLSNNKSCSFAVFAITQNYRQHLCTGHCNPSA